MDESGRQKWHWATESRFDGRDTAPLRGKRLYFFVCDRERTVYSLGKKNPIRGLMLGRKTPEWLTSHCLSKCFFDFCINMWYEKGRGKKAKSVVFLYTALYFGCNPSLIGEWGGNRYEITKKDIFYEKNYGQMFVTIIVTPTVLSLVDWQRCPTCEWRRVCTRCLFCCFLKGKNRLEQQCAG